jgi:rod shape determining protein RodA
MIDRRFLSHLNWALAGILLVLFLVGVLNLYSASSLRAGTGLAMTPYYKKQLIWGLMGLGCMLVTVSLDYRHLKTLALPLFVLSIILLAALPFFGTTINGAKRWLDFGIVSFQPSELGKISVLLMGAAFLSKDSDKLSIVPFLKICGVALIPAMLVVTQPDLGSALSLLMLIGGMILYKGMTSGLFKTLAVGMPMAKQRILTFIDPTKDPLGSGYHIIQSQIAIGSGQFWGKGFLEGTQSQLRFLPEKHTDFALAVFGEEWGFAGCIFLLALFCAFLYQLSLVAQESKDSFGSHLAAGVFFYFFWQILINMGMVLGIMPVVGIPLPFISYGGSSMLVNLCLIGIVLNVSMRRFFFKKD